MRLKSFHGRTLTEAMAQVRAMLGDDAIIIATHDDEHGGVRVTAALDDTAPQPAAVTAPPLDSRRDALDDIAIVLERHGTPRELAEKLTGFVMNAAQGTSFEVFASVLDHAFRYTPLASLETRDLILVGPPGVGKTSAIGKMAASAVMQRQRLGVITTDIERAGALAQLRTYTEKLGIPLLEADDASSLSDARAVHPEITRWVIDTTGVNPFNAVERDALKNVLKAGKAAGVLVLPAGLDPVDGAEAARAFAQIGAEYLVLTKMDIARRLGSTLALVDAARLPLLATSSAATIASGLQPCTAENLAALLWPEAAPKQNSQTSTQASKLRPESPREKHA